jgi:hypothetical protein
MQHVGWTSLINNIDRKEHDQLQRIKEAIFKDLQQYKQADGIHFNKKVFFVCAMK